MKKLVSLILALMMCAVSGLSLAEGGVIGGADGPTSVIVAEPAFILPGDLELAALEAGRKGTTTLAVTDVSGINTGDADMDAALVELIKALGVTSSAQGDESGFAVTISGNSVLDMGLSLSGDDIYVKSNLLGGTIVIGADEVETLVNRLMDMLVMMEAMTEEEAAQFKDIFGSLAETIPAAMQNEAFNATLTEEDLLTMDFSAVTAALETVMAKAQPVVDPVIPKNCDPAVIGMTLNATNEDVVMVSKAMLQFVKDNPKLMNYIGGEFGIGTEDQLIYMWNALEEYSGYESWEEFRADNPTLEDIIDEAIAELDGKKVLDGDYVISIYVDEAGLPVYMSFTLPLFIEQESLYTMVSDAGESDMIASPSADMLADLEPKGETKVVELVYYRQTVAQGVSHVINITVDGETATVDALVSGNTTHIVLSAPDEEPIVIDAALEGNDLTTTLTYVPDEETAITCTFDGSYLYTETEYVLAGKLTLVEEFTPEEIETPTLNGLTLPGFEAHKPKAETNTLTLDIKADYDLNGVDFNGVTDIVIEYNDVHVGLQAKSFTSDADGSIMSGEVIRPAELDDAAFANWFVGVINTINSWAGNLMMALPESLLTMMMYTGM